MCFKFSAFLYGAGDAIIISFLHSLNGSLALNLSNIMIKLHACKIYFGTMIVVHVVIVCCCLFLFISLHLLLVSKIVCISSYWILGGSDSSFIMESAIGLTNHVLQKLWRMKMKLFVSFFISYRCCQCNRSLFRTLWRVRSIGVTASHGCCSSFFLLLLSLSVEL